ncbi:Maturation and nuclear export of 40S ribosomal subunits interacting protein [Podospora pseudoanserina]|uniref:Maturation and nuclear export of 40S ribosomal subunits interacting protein n=1 Tax=Podospora pseudoanserina TaxID=2609844 RepID=A0ABR0IRX3_9PEZI|nr:Maturation and nuclear export of 40S ribosomal subunits interacting protein [Podospora pseudoanserina]
MAAATKEPSSASAGKRKRQENGDKCKKRRKSGGDEGVDLKAQLKQLEAEILESRKHYNNIATLLELAQKYDEDRPTAIAASETLCRVFVRLLAMGCLVERREASEKDATVTKWLRERLADFREVLLRMFNNEKLALPALLLAMSLLKVEAQHLDGRDQPAFPRYFFTQVIYFIIQSPVEQLREEFTEKFIDEFDDIRFYTFAAISEFLRDPSADLNETVRAIIFNLLLNIDDVPSSNKDLDTFYIEPPTTKKRHPVRSLSQHKSQAQDAWLALMQLGLSKDQRKKILSVMSNSIAPWFTNPELLMDFLTDCYNAGGSISLLALSGVFYLIQERNLDYPEFYTKLYSLLDADMLHSKHRSRFLRLLDTFLGSSHLPAVMVASFIKKLARLALNAPPSAIVAIVPWFYNLFKKHPLTTFMMHRVPRTEEEKQKIEEGWVEDVFLAWERDPMETRAIESCLWEVVQLQGHWHPNVATIAKIISEQFTKQAYNVEDFLDHSYGSLFEAEMGKEIKKPPVVEFMIPKRVFTKVTEEEEKQGLKDSLVVGLWDFGTA